jgi:hypothetical protein
MTISWPGVLAHEVAHEDLGHVAKAKALGAGLNIGMVILDQIIPGSGALTPIAGTLVARAYSRQEEYAADRHGAELLERTGHSKQLMIDTLTWLIQAADRIARLLRDGIPARKTGSPRSRRSALAEPMDCETLAKGSALEMIAACFRHQHPEAFGGMPVSSPALPVRSATAGRHQGTGIHAGDERGGDGTPGGSTPVSEAGWLVVAIVAGVLFVFGWIKRERWIAGRRRRG